MLTTILVVLLVVSGTCRGFSSGAPSSRCLSMQPGHAHDPQSHPTPYVISITGGAKTYQPNNNITVTIHAPDHSGVQVRGFLLEVRTVSGNPVGPIGTFVNVNSGTKSICENKALTHRTWRSRKEFTATWMAPPDVTLGEIVFVATVVKSYSTFWSNVRSDVLTLFVPPTVQPTQVSPNMTWACAEKRLKPLPEELPHVAILCSNDVQCPCGWPCCPLCVDGICSGHAICRQNLEKGNEMESDNIVNQN